MIHCQVRVLASQFAGLLASTGLKGPWQTGLPLRNLRSFVASVLNSVSWVIRSFVGNRRELRKRASIMTADPGNRWEQATFNTSVPPN